MNMHTLRHMFKKLMEMQREKVIEFVMKQVEYKPKFVSTHNLSTNISWILKRSNKNCMYLYSPRRKYSTKLPLVKNVIDIKHNNTNAVEISSETSSEVVQNITSFSMFGSKASIDLIKKSNTSKKLCIPSVTYILKKTRPAKAQMALDIWKETMINKMGEEQFHTHIQELMYHGQLFHTCIEKTLLQKRVTIPPQVELAYSSIKSVLSDIQRVEKLEAYVIHPQLQYRGVVDCIASYRDELHVIDWKKSDMPKKTLTSTYDAPVQLAAYIGAINASDQYPFTIDRGLIVIGYTSGNPATVLELKDDTLKYCWENWLERLEQYYNKYDNK